MIDKTQEGFLQRQYGSILVSDGSTTKPAKHIHFLGENAKYNNKPLYIKSMYNIGIYISRYICNKILRLLCHTSSSFFLCRKAKYLETCNTNNKLDFADVVEITTIFSLVCRYIIYYNRNWNCTLYIICIYIQNQSNFD